MPNSIRTGDVIADRYRLLDLLQESEGGLFWRAFDQVLARHVAFHVIGATDRRAPLLLEAAKRSATIVDPRILRVLDADERDGMCFVVNEWGSGQSLDILLADGPLSPRRAAWIVSEVAETIAMAHAQGQAHGRLVPENVLIDHNGSVKIIGFAVDAALHGLPAGRRSTDTVDLAGLLYAALVGKWPGASRSNLPSAPLTGGQPLRPRKVRAGIPKPLDVICDDVLSPFAHTSGNHSRAIDSAAGIHEALVDFIGDPGALAAAEKDHAPTVSWPARASFGPLGAPSADEEVPLLPDEPAEDPGPDPVDPSLGGPETVAGVPVFESDWLTPRKDRPPPPPKFEQPPERPLYAPDPVRRPRESPTGENSSSTEYWPWETGQGATTGTGPIIEPEEDDSPVPGRSWLRLAAGIAAAALLLTAVAFAFTLGRGDGGGTPGEDPTSGATSTGAGAVIKVAGVEDFDPQGDPPEENPEDAPNVLDRDPTTTWSTNGYDQNFGPGGLKDGIGLVLDLGKVHSVSAVRIDFVGAPTGVSAYLSDQAPSGKPAARATADQESVTLKLPDASSGRYLVVWLTSLPQPDRFRAEISRITVRS